MIALVDTLKTRLPEWHFEPYGKAGAVACFPPGGPGADRYRELSAVAPITSVCGPLYVVTCTREPGRVTYSCGCSYETGYGRETYQDYHCATCRRELWERCADPEREYSEGKDHGV